MPQILWNKWIDNWLCVIYIQISEEINLLVSALCDYFKVIIWDIFSFSVFLSLSYFPLIAAHEAVVRLNSMNDGFTFPLTVESTSFPSENYCIHCLGPLQYAAIFSIAL